MFFFFFFLLSKIYILKKQAKDTKKGSLSARNSSKTEKGTTNLGRNPLQKHIKTQDTTRARTKNTTAKKTHNKRLTYYKQKNKRT